MQSEKHQSRQGGLPSPDRDPLALVATALFPASIVALETETQPVERLMGLQSAFSRLVAVLTGVRWPQPTLLHRKTRAVRFQ